MLDDIRYPGHLRACDASYANRASVQQRMARSLLIRRIRLILPLLDNDGVSCNRISVGKFMVGKGSWAETG